MGNQYARLVTKVAEAGELDGRGTFSALVSVFDILDTQGDVIDKGAFKKSIERVQAGDKMPVIWSHTYSDPHAIIGEITAIKETERGLYVEATLDVDDNPMAAQIHRQMVRGRLKEFSIGGVIEEWYWRESDEGPDEFHIKSLDLWEVGPCFKGANTETELLSVKSRLAETTKTDATTAPVEPTPEPSARKAATLPQATRAALGLIATFTPHDEGETL